MSTRREGRAPIVVGYDGSEAAAHAIASAGRLLSPRRALVVHSYVGADDSDEADRVSAEGAQLAIEAGLEAQPLAVEQGANAWRTLIATADQHQAAAIVAGARGRSQLASALLGSVSSGLVHHSALPVLVVPDHAVPKSDGPALFCYDGSGCSERAITVSQQLLASREALVLNIWESWSERTPGLAGLSGAVRGMARELDEIADSQSAELADTGAALAREAGFDVHALSKRCRRSLWTGALEAAEERDASVVVLGSRGLTGLSSALGSVSYGVTHHSARPVLIVPPVTTRGSVRSSL